jgi:Aspartyl protease
LEPTEQVAYRENHLSHSGEAGAEEQAKERTYLEALKAQLKGPPHNCRLATNMGSTDADLLLLNREQSNQLRGYGLAVALNQQNSKLLLDTGAHGVLIDRKLAQRAGLTKLFDTAVGGFGDQGKSKG